MNDVIKNKKIELLMGRLEAYYEAEMAVLKGQSYQIGTRKLERADLAEIRKAISELETEISVVENGGKRKAFRALPRDI